MFFSKFVVLKMSEIKNHVRDENTQYLELSYDP
jgi:hypothetical protein